MDNANVGIYGEHRGCVYTIGIYTVFFVLRVLFNLFEWVLGVRGMGMCCARFRPVFSVHPCTEISMGCQSVKRCDVLDIVRTVRNRAQG